jgi:L-threonylcarbamoyladenylate synthase
MKIIGTTDLDIAKAITILHAGGIIVHATETCYGFACDISNPDAVQKLFQLKDRPAGMPLSVLFSALNEAKRYLEWNDHAEGLAKKHLPGPLTIILPLKQKTPSDIVHSTSTLGIRISSYPLAHDLVEKFGKPISTTSANIHGKPNTYSVKEVCDQFKKRNIQPDLILDSGVLPKNPSSKVIDCTRDPPHILRE